MPTVFEAIIDSLKEECFVSNWNQEKWKEVANQFEWQFPHCCGAMDGKHIRIKKPEKSGSMFSNYKNFFSVVLMALVDADYKIIWVDVGGEGSASDAQLFKHSELRRQLEDDTIDFPQPTPLPGHDEPIPYYFIGDDAFPLRP